ncbi:MAG: U32 family peptidase, partial [Akkermansia sp.]|nr:U32 family peptidase [Akkermansia sp.]
YLGEEWETWSGCSNSLALEQRHHLGRVLRWYPKVQVAEIRLEAHPLSPGDKIEITGPTTGIVSLVVPEVRCDDENGVTRIVDTAPKGARALVALSTKVRHGDKVYLITRRKLK